jgi:hypothetical protein
VIITLMMEAVSFSEMLVNIHQITWIWRYELDSSGSEEKVVVGSCEHGNEHSGPIKGRKLLD